ncbi:MAG: TonB-dependent receptor [Myxococcales bacterium]|nr:MAG: TonB-dependent receptor [Myxococcales bacterium]
MLCSATALAQYQAVAEVERPISSSYEEDVTSTASVVAVDTQRTAVLRTEELLLQVPGTRVQRFGDFASFSSLSLRGAEFDQTTVLLGTIPLQSADGGAFDLSTLPAHMVERLEVFRGSTPAWLGTAGIGGTLRIVPQQSEHSSAELNTGIGSFGLATTNLSVSAKSASGLKWTGVSGFAHSDGDFQYTDQRGTLFDSSDDQKRTRSNNHKDQAYGLLHLEAPLAGGKLEALAFIFERISGEPGPAVQSSLYARRNLARAIGALQYSKERSTRGKLLWRTELLASIAHTRNRFSDRFSEIGLGHQDSDNHSTRTQLRAAAERRLIDWLNLTGILDWQHEMFSPQDAYAQEALDGSQRDRLAATMEMPIKSKLAALPFELRPSARMELIHAKLSDTAVQSSSSTQLISTFRLGAALALWPGLALTASLARAARAPSMIELFGDQGLLLGNTSLEPETAYLADVGVNFSEQLGELQSGMQIRLFASRIESMIVFNQINDESNFASRNLGGQTEIYGVETNTSLEWKRALKVIANATVMKSKSTQNLALPLRPQLSAFTRVQYTFYPDKWFDELAVFSDLVYRSNFFTDLVNTVLLREQCILNAGIQSALVRKTLDLRFQIRNVLDSANKDLLAFPLPGRSFALELTWHTDGP